MYTRKWLWVKRQCLSYFNLLHFFLHQLAARFSERERSCQSISLLGKTQVKSCSSFFAPIQSHCSFLLASSSSSILILVWRNYFFAQSYADSLYSGIETNGNGLGTVPNEDFPMLYPLSPSYDFLAFILLVPLKQSSQSAMVSWIIRLISMQ